MTLNNKFDMGESALVKVRFSFTNWTRTPRAVRPTTSLRRSSRLRPSRLGRQAATGFLNHLSEQPVIRPIDNLAFSPGLVHP